MEKILVGFGKHSHLTYKELATDQPGYVRWLFRQDWFSGAHPKLYEYLDSIGMRPNEVAKVECSTSDSDSDYVKSDNNDSKLTHNQMQVLFLDFQNIKKLLRNIFDDDTYDYSVDDIIFEDISDVDIILKLTRCRRYNIYEPLLKSLLRWWYNEPTCIHLLIELKTSVTSDYPEILRQLRRQKRSYTTHYDTSNVTIKQVLVTQSYNGDVPLDSVRGVYKDIDVIVF